MRLTFGQTNDKSLLLKVKRISYLILFRKIVRCLITKQKISTVDVK